MAPGIAGARCHQGIAGQHLQAMVNAIDPRLAQLNAVTQVPDGWLIPNILETITRLGTNSTCFGLRYQVT